MASIVASALTTGSGDSGDQSALVVGLVLSAIAALFSLALSGRIRKDGKT